LSDSDSKWIPAFRGASDEPTKPYKENPTMYEQACLRRVMRFLAGLPLIDPRQAAPFNVHGAWLRGEYPATQLVVSASRLGEPAEMAFGLWDDEFGRVLPDDSNRAAPAQVSSDIAVQVWELS